MIWRSFLMMVTWVCVGFVCLCSASAHNAVTGLRIGAISVNEAQGLRIVVETILPSKAKLSLLQEPYRLVIDLPKTSWEVALLPLSGNLSIGAADSYRFGSPQPNLGRLVIELRKPAVPARAFTLPPATGGHRFVIDLVDVGETAFMVAAAALQKGPAMSFAEIPPDAEASSNPITAVKQKMTLPRSKRMLLNKLPSGANSSVDSRDTIVTHKNRRWVVFIDAGHGGKDPGAIGRTGTKEKNITLTAARDLAEQLRATGKVQPILARSDDRFLRLRERIRLARRQKADVFISLHADSAQSTKARGISVFTLSDIASDKEAAALARKENKSDLIGGPDLGVEDPDAAGELLRMFQRESMNQSSQLAAAILEQIRDMPGGDRRGHRFAGFAVLKAPDMPSVLVEMGFLSNRDDEKNLRNSEYISTLNRKLSKATINYLNSNGPKL